MADLSVDDALSQLLKSVKRLPSEDVPVEAAAGRVLAGDLAAKFTQPPFDASAMDGYALRAADALNAPVTLKVLGTSAAGAGFRGEVKAGEAVRILTGAPMPAGADTIVIQENVTRRGDRIELHSPAIAGSNIRTRGINLQQGQIVLRAGRKLGARDLLLAASAGHGRVPVVKKPRVAILATGDELVPPGAVPGPDQIISSNSVGLAALVKAFGGEPVMLGIAPDREDAIAARVREAKDCDVIITSGGVSVGDHDHVKPAFASLGMVLDFWKIAMRPGKPLMVGSLGGQRVLGLPGNPVSAMATARLFLVPLMRALLGLEPRDVPVLMPCTEALPANGPRQHYMRALVSETASGPVVAPLEDQDSSLTLVFAVANALLIRAPDAPPLAKGARVPVLRLDF